MLSIKQGGIKYYFWVFGMTQHAIEPQSPVNTLPTPSFKIVLFVV